MPPKSAQVVQAQGPRPSHHHTANSNEVAPPRPPEMLYALECSGRLLNEAHELASGLESAADRLGCPHLPQSAELSNKDAEPRTGALGTLDSTNGQLVTLAARLRYVLERLERLV